MRKMESRQSDLTEYGTDDLENTFFSRTSVGIIL